MLVWMDRREQSVGSALLSMMILFSLAQRMSFVKATLILMISTFWLEVAELSIHFISLLVEGSITWWVMVRIIRMLKMVILKGPRVGVRLTLRSVGLVGCLSCSYYI